MSTTAATTPLLESDFYGFQAGLTDRERDSLGRLRAYLEAEVGDLNDRFETRKLVDRAKGLLNEKMGLSEPEAFRWIQKASMDRRLTMHDVAKAIIDQLAPKK